VSETHRAGLWWQKDVALLPRLNRFCSYLDIFLTSVTFSDMPKLLLTLTTFDGIKLHISVLNGFIKKGPRLANQIKSTAYECGQRQTTNRKIDNNRIWKQSLITYQSEMKTHTSSTASQRLKWQQHWQVQDLKKQIIKHQKQTRLMLSVVYWLNIKNKQQHDSTTLLSNNYHKRHL